jgi:glycosyltransferase involved in cell wall biosynthesis
VGNGGEPYPREVIIALKRDWHFFWYSSWSYSLARIPYHDLIDLFVVWDDIANEIKASGRTDCIIVRGGSEIYQRHDLLFFPVQDTPIDIDLLYIARFIKAKRYDIATRCVRYLVERKRDLRAVFLVGPASEPGARAWVLEQRKRFGLEKNLRITSVPLRRVNSFLNRARISLFTSDDEGLCRAVLQTLLAERPLLCYSGTRAQIRMLYDDRYFRYYDAQTEESVGKAAWSLLESKAESNAGARRYVLGEKNIRFYDLREWQSIVLAAAAPLYLREGQILDPRDIVPAWRLGLFGRFWAPFRL